jgi:5-methylcytosine-specific restriction endonuclease McrA
MPILPSKRPQPWRPAAKPFEGHKYTTFYSNAPWRRLRDQFIRQHPLCKHCEANGIITASHDIDHIKPINPDDPYNTDGGKYGEALNPDNLQALCKKCHIKKTAARR